MVNKKISTRFFSKQQENKVAKLINGKTVANSGARPYQKGDRRLFGGGCIIVFEVYA